MTLAVATAYADPALLPGTHENRLLEGPRPAWLSEGADGHRAQILSAAYRILKTGETYLELGGAYLDQLHKDRRRQSLVRGLEAFGFDVHLTSKCDPSAQQALSTEAHTVEPTLNIQKTVLPEP